jgi:hypothetical protein
LTFKSRTKYKGLALMVGIIYLWNLGTYLPTNLINIKRLPKQHLIGVLQDKEFESKFDSLIKSWEKRAPAIIKLD